MASEPSRDSVLLNMMDVAEDYQSASVHEGYANQPDKNVKLDVLEGQAAENIENLREEMTTDEYGREILDISDVSEEFNNSAVASLSLNVNETEMDILNISTSDDEDVENEKADQSVVSDTKEDEMEQKSDIHCALCNDYFDCPKLLECFHTFCQSCLLKKIKSSHKFIFCPICRHRSNIPKEGIEKLIDNVVAASLVAAARKEQAVADCIVCKLHNEQKASVGQCLDCSDMMCQDCCEKHTYSRLTAKHKVVTFEEMKSEKYAGLLKETRTVSCMHHSAEIAEYFCSNCYIPVCKECSISGHSLHSCETLTDAVARKKVALKEMMESLKQESDLKLVDDSKESEILISEFEENEFKKLRDVKEKMISIIEQKYNKCAERLQNEFDIKRRKYCKHKRNFILKERKIVDSFLDSLSFILREGSDVECAMLEKFVESAVEHRRRYLSKVRPKLSRKSNFPSVFLYKEHLNVLEGLTFFTTSTFLRDQKDRERKAHTANATMHVENAEVRMKIGSSYQTSMNNVPVDRKPVYKSGEVVAPKGRGFAFQGIANPRQSMSYNRPSLLGQCPAQNRQYEYQDFSSENSYLSNGRAQNFGNYYTARNTGNKNSLFGGPPFRLNLLTSFDVKISQDQKVPDISGLAFIHLVNFAVADARNHRLKIFNINGKLIRYIDDPGPMSMTFCDKHLIWSSQFSAIRFFDIQQQKIVKVQRVPQTASHPLTSFNNVKYLIGNMQHSRVEACTIDGSHVHVIQPRGRDGKTLQDVSHIAARSSDQLVCVDEQMKKVVVNDFDGNFIGEYSHDDFITGGVCITENDDIFVTDQRRKKLILLNRRGEYIREWNTVVDSPSSVASNGMGRVIVAGNGKTVSLYDYSYD